MRTVKEHNARKFINNTEHEAGLNHNIHFKQTRLPLSHPRVQLFRIKIKHMSQEHLHQFTVIMT